MAKDARRFDQQVAELLSPVLHTGEELIAAVRVNYNGTIPPNIVTLDVGISSVAAPSDEPPVPVERDPDVGVRFPAAKQMLLALTGGRLFVWSLGFSGKPKQFAGEVPLSAIDEVRFDRGGLGGELGLLMKSGALVELEFLRGEAGEQFAAELGALVEG